MELDDLINAIDIVDYISQFVELEEKNGEFWGLSPLKDEKTPSFSVRKESKSFYDFSSGIGGNVFTFVRYYYKCSHKEAAEILRTYAGLSEDSAHKSQKLAATTVCKKFTPCKSAKKPCSTTKYPQNYMEKYEKAADKLAVWESEGISRASLDKFEVYYDGFSNRLVYPIRNMRGEIVNIGGRTLDPDWKAKGLRKYTYFSGWGEMNIVYGLFENLEYIKQAHEVIIFEGCKSVLMADTWGIHNCAALLTSHLSPMQMKLLASIGCNVVFALDKEVDVTQDHNINRLKSYVNVFRYIDAQNLLMDKDSPVDRGENVFRMLYENRVKIR